MDNYKFRPLTGLLNIKKEEISNADILSTLNYAEEKINSSPSGRVTHLALLFYLIKIMQSAGISFYVKGGVIQHYFIEERTRPTYDLDIIINDDADALINKLELALSSLNDSLTFKIKNYKKAAADNIYYYDTFNIEIAVIQNDKEYVIIHIDGIKNNRIFSEIRPLAYKMPEVIAHQTTFQGVPIEYVIAEKIIAITNELERPYKHLVDVYGLINLDINKELLKKYLEIIVDNDNQIRAKLNKPIIPYIYQIKENKKFVGSYIFIALQSGYNIPFEDMVKKVNNWLSNNLK